MIEEQNGFVWNFNDGGGSYIPKLGYISSLSYDLGMKMNSWKAFWKVQALLKEKLHVWLFLNNNALTWDIFQKKSPFRVLACAHYAKVVVKQMNIYYFLVNIQRQCGMM